MIVITGARGFIGSNLAKKMNDEGHDNLILVDELANTDKTSNLSDLQYKHLIDRNDFIAWAKENTDKIDFIFHLGARTDTTESDKELLDKLNYHYSQHLWTFCTEYNIPFIYASSAATYGDGQFGYDDESTAPLLPLNQYGWSKQNFDLWTKEQEKTPPYYVGLKFFNVYGANEYHKGRMASVIFHAYNQISETGGMKLFQSHNKNYANGEQKRDFIYVKDIVNVCFFLYKNKVENGIYNLGTGTARTFNDLVRAVFTAMQIDENISYIPMPLDIRDKYQYYTEAKMNKLINQGYKTPFYSLEDGVKDYIENYLSKR
ncbi:MAG: ADP-glyceromanno-heptose 6-epimerase [Chitinophagales bacterium]